MPEICSYETPLLDSPIALSIVVFRYDFYRLDVHLSIDVGTTVPYPPPYLHATGIRAMDSIFWLLVPVRKLVLYQLVLFFRGV